MVLVVGANDVVNPIAETDPASPIYGMPILKVDDSRTVMIIKRSLSPGYAGIKNVLFEHDNAMMIFGDAKKSDSGSSQGAQGSRRVRRLSTALGLLLLLLASQSPAASPPAVRGSDGAVASSEAAATWAGLEILRQGGNAVDAAVATALALAVVHPSAGNIGGGGFAVVRFEGEFTSLDFREVAPAAATADMYLDESGEVMPAASTIGALAAGVPGTPKGLYALHQRFGGLDWKAVVAPSARLALEGFPVSRRLHEKLADRRDFLERFPTTAKVWLPSGSPPPIGSAFRLPALGALLSAYAELGPDAIVSGDAAAAIERTATEHGGILTAADLAAYEPVWREPVFFQALGWHFASMDLPSSGGIILGQTLAILERLEWATAPRFGRPPCPPSDRNLAPGLR